MSKHYFYTSIFYLISILAYSQSLKNSADSIRSKYRVPELAYVVASSDRIVDIQAIGKKRLDTTSLATNNDRFYLGSNTKAITGMIAALLVSQHKIEWNTSFFSIFPNLRATSNNAYAEVTLQNLLSARIKLIPLNLTDSFPSKALLTGKPIEQRRKLASWILQQPPALSDELPQFNNAGYILAACMLEKASSKTWEQLITELGLILEVDLQAGYPNQTDRNQAWGHDVNSHPLAPIADYKLDLLTPVDNMNMKLSDYGRFLQSQLQGLLGQSSILLTPSIFHFLHYGISPFAIGWNWIIDKDKGHISYHESNIMGFRSQVYVYKERNIAFAVFENTTTPESYTAINAMVQVIQKWYKLPTAGK